MITGRPPTTRRETYLRNLLSVVSKFLSFGIVEIGRPRYARLRGDIISEMICKEIVYDVKTEVEFCTEELQVVGEDGEELLVSPIIHTVQEDFTREECRVIPDVVSGSGQENWGSRTH